MLNWFPREDTPPPSNDEDDSPVKQDNDGISPEDAESIPNPFPIAIDSSQLGGVVKKFPEV